MAQQSAGILAFRRNRPGGAPGAVPGTPSGDIEVLLVHPGGPFWKNKDAGAWSIPKGELAAGEEPLAAARREFLEELGMPIDGAFVALTPVRQRGGKTVFAFAIEADIDTTAVRSNTFSMEWPPRSGKLQAFPEIDAAMWFDLGVAQAKINAGQVALLNQLRERLA